MFIAFMVSGPASFAVTKTYTMIVLTKEKTVFVNDKEVLGVLDFNYKVTKNANMSGSSESAFVSYKGNLIEATIKLKAQNPVLDKILKDKTQASVRYMHLDKKTKKISGYDFSGVSIGNSTVNKKNNKIVSVAYKLRATGLVENPGK